MLKQLGHYQIVSELGRGGMGVVYKAHEPSLHRFVAIKVLADQIAKDPKLVARFKREAQSAASLNHPNVVQIFYIGEDRDRHFFVMEYVEGESLSERIQRERHLPPAKAVEILLQAAQGLAAAHEKGVIHRDLKPANIMISGKEIVKLTDFGIARMVRPDEKLTETGALLGTPGYLSPEVCLAKEPDGRSDIFSLGVVFFEMLVGKAPFRGDSLLSVLRQVVEEPAPDVRQLNAAVDHRVQGILEKMIEKDPRARYQHCGALIVDLKAYHKGAPAHAETEIVAGSLAEATTPGTGADERTIPTQFIPPAEAPTRQPQAPRGESPPPLPKLDEVRERQAAVFAPPRKKGKTRLWIPLLAVVLFLALLGAATPLVWDRIQDWRQGRTPVAGDGFTETGAPEIQENPEEGDNSGPDTEEEVQTGANGLAQTVTDTEDQPSQSETEITPGLKTKSSPGPGETTAQSGDYPEQNESITGTGQPIQTKNLGVTTKKGALAGVLEQKSALPEDPKILLVASGDPMVSQPVEDALAEYLNADSFHLLDHRSLPAEMLNRSPNVAELSLELERAGGQVLVLAEIIHLGERTLSFGNRHDTAYRARLKVHCIHPGSGKRQGSWQRELEYTTLNAVSKAEEAARKIYRELLAWLRNLP